MQTTHSEAMDDSCDTAKSDGCGAPLGTTTHDRILGGDSVNKVSEEQRKEALELKEEGNALYLQSKYEEACAKYTAALRVCPLGASKDRQVDPE